MPKPSEYRNLSFRHTLFSRIREEIEKRTAGRGGEDLIALHVGDTHFDLPRELLEPLPEEPWGERLSRYGDTQGEIELRRRLVEKLRRRNRLPVSSGREIQLTFGATGGLFLAMRRLLRPGDEVLVLAPHWTILRVVAATAGVKLVMVPAFDRLAGEPGRTDLAEWLAPCLGDRTAALYFNSPNNPSGVMLTPEHLASIARFARERDLWVFADEAYEDFVWNDVPYASIGSLEGMFERTVSVFSFSKSYAAAGLRLGYVAAPAGVIAALNPAHVGVGYEPPRPAQVQAIRGIERHGAVVDRLRAAYREGLRAAVENLRRPYLGGEGSFYLFIDLGEEWAALDDEARLERMLSAGVVLAPGSPFGGERYRRWARFCYTSEPPERVAEAARRVNLL